MPKQVWSTGKRLSAFSVKYHSVEFTSAETQAPTMENGSTLEKETTEQTTPIKTGVKIY